MDPYLESRWSDVHSALVIAIRESLQPGLPADLRTRAEERVLLEDAEAATEPAHRADVAVVETDPPPRPATPPASGQVTVEPIVITYHEEHITEPWVQIIDSRQGQRVITAIEVLSPWNKAPGRLNTMYRRKLSDYRRGDVSVVELDLLRQPPRTRMAVRTEDLPQDRRTPYLACIRNAWAPQQWIVYPLPLRARLPRIPIPLRQSEAPVDLDLQPLVERVYTGGGHDDIDYSKPAEPPLVAEDAAWAQALITSRRPTR